MATTNYHIAGTTGVGSSTQLPAKGFKLEIPTANGVLIVFDRRFWSVKHLGKSAAGAEVSTPVFFRHGDEIPTADYASNTAATRESLTIEAGADELIQIKKNADNDAVCFLALTNAAVLQFRPNAAEYK